MSPACRQLINCITDYLHSINSINNSERRLVVRRNCAQLSFELHVTQLWGTIANHPGTIKRPVESQNYVAANQIFNICLHFVLCSVLQRAWCMVHGELRHCRCCGSPRHAPRAVCKTKYMRRTHVICAVRRCFNQRCFGAAVHKPLVFHV